MIMAVDALTALALETGNALHGADKLLASAESCTGGGIAEAVTRIPGSSAWFERGFVTYSNAAKADMLGVSAATLDLHGAVSEEAAREMAQGALAHSRAAIALAVTGVAGPSGGTAKKPVGTVCFAWAERDGRLFSARRQFEGDREAVRRQTVVFALQGVLRLLDGPGPL